MKITINDQRSQYAIQDEFCALFPNLKLEFYKKAPGLKNKFTLHEQNNGA